MDCSAELILQKNGLCALLGDFNINCHLYLFCRVGSTRTE
jgi:hypothetical protein